MEKQEIINIRNVLEEATLALNDLSINETQEKINEARGLLFNLINKN